jgi:hypothetical protein
LLVVIIGTALFGGCASTPKSPDATTQEKEKAGDKNKSAVFEQPMDKTQKAALDALAVFGFEIKKQEPDFIEGRRPNKWGLFVGSGGETMKVWLESPGPTQTKVKVKTEHSFMGIAGQKNWDDKVLAELTKALKL